MLDIVSLQNFKSIFFYIQNLFYIRVRAGARAGTRAKAGARKCIEVSYSLFLL